MVTWRSDEARARALHSLYMNFVTHPSPILITEAACVGFRALDFLLCVLGFWV